VLRIHEIVAAEKTNARTNDLALDLVDGLGETTNVLAGDTSNRDTTILSSVDGVLYCVREVVSSDRDIKQTHLLSQRIHLLGCKTGVCEHANLGSDVAPVVLAAELLEVLLEQGAHGNDAVGHALDLTKPLLVQRRVVKDLGGNAGTVDWRVRVKRADKNLDLRVDTLLLICGLADDGEGTNTLTVETLFHG
jgi:hypothetical protein